MTASDPAPFALADPHARAVEACLAALDAGPDGLSTPESARRLVLAGPNRLPAARSRGWLRRLVAQVHNVLIYVLLAAAAVTAALGHAVDTAVILAVVLANAVIGFVQEGKAESAMAAIRDMLAPRAAVLRDGRRRPARRSCRATSCCWRPATAFPPTCA